MAVRDSERDRVRPALQRATIARGAALAAIAAAVVLVVLLLFSPFGGAAEYQVTATFANAGQLVKGNQVIVGGVAAGTVTDIEITRSGQAEITLSVDEPYAPLRRGTRATIKQALQSGVANRYVDLAIPPRDSGPEIADGGRLSVDETETAVDLDQLLNTLDPPTRRGLQNLFKGSMRQYAGRSQQANRGWEYASPALSSTKRVFGELTHDTRVLERFLVDSSVFVTALADRRRDLASLIGNLRTTTRALGAEKTALADSIARLPDFMRNANTTFVDLRSALDEVDPLVEESKPVARKLRPFLAELRPFARDARPAVADLSAILRRPGASNDLIDLTRTLDPLARVAVDGGERNGKNRPGAFEEIATASRGAKPIIAFGRPYTPELFGWFDDFSTPGTYDALGGLLRFQVVVNAFSAQVEPGRISPVPLPSRAGNFKQLMDLGETRRCPGGGEAPAPDGSNIPSAELQKEVGCRDADRAVDP
jgi:phospholipid/cholesterol/gamma-HCH transport system substrate-binding protein